MNTNDLRRAIVSVDERFLSVDERFLTVAEPCDEQHYPQPSDPDKAQAALALLLDDLRLLYGVAPVLRQAALALLLDDLRMLAEGMGIDFDKALADSK